MHELSLVFFTFLAQAAVGIVILSTIGLLIGKVERSGHQTALLAAFASLTLGGIASLTHLGQPLRAINSLAAVGQSPMSNEVIATILFGALLVTSLACLKLGRVNNTLKVISLFASFAGLALINTIPTIYVIESVAAWNTVYTTLYMVLTAFIVGAAVVFLISGKRLFKYIALISLLVGLVAMPSYFSQIAELTPNLFGENVIFWMAKVAFAGLAIISLSSNKTNNIQFASLAVVFVTASELAGRIGFFELWHIGM